MSKSSDERRRVKRLIMRRERVLAEMIANGAEHGLEFREGAHGLRSDKDRYVPIGSGCCAIGAYVACKARTVGPSLYDVYREFTARTGLDHARVYSGNDGYSDDGWSDPDVAVGAAYRAYHLVDG